MTKPINRIEPFLAEVQKPGRYIGCEFGQTVKPGAEVSFAFCFPDTYEIGMSNLGVRILYGALNACDYVRCERAYAPWPDMEAKLREHGIPLYTHESGDALGDFDFVAFTLQYELCYTNVLNMLELSGIPLLAAERGEDCPIVIGGGPCAFNAEPIADFFDIFSIGEGEEALPELTALYASMRRDGSYTRRGFLKAAATRLRGFYVPSMYEITYAPDNTIASCVPLDGAPEKVVKRIVSDMDTAFFPDKLVMPYIETVHDRIVLEVFRGCIRGCRFCQAGMLFRPVREKSPEVLDCQARCLYQNTGYDEISLSSLSISDYTRLGELTDRLLSWTRDNKVSLSMPSMRLDSFTAELMEKISQVRSSGLTFAPEAGTQRLRDVINKNITEQDLKSTCATAFASGKTQIKLYFMQGLPTETDEDLLGIGQLAETVIQEYYHCAERNRARTPQITVSVSCFVPKPFTPFQWEAQDTLERLSEKQKLVGSGITRRSVRYNWHDAQVSRLEAAFARGSRRLGKVLLEAHRLGARFDSWDEYFDPALWDSAFAAAGEDIAFYANRVMGEDEILPWDIIDAGISKEFLLRERKRAYGAQVTASCREKCSGCGANRLGGEHTCCPKN